MPATLIFSNDGNATPVGARGGVPNPYSEKLLIPSPSSSAFAEPALLAAAQAE